MNKDSHVDISGDTVCDDKRQREQQRLSALNDKATLLSPVNTLRRGYSLVKLGDKYVTAADQLAPSDKVTLQFANGTADATVTNIPENQK